LLSTLEVPVTSVELVSAPAGLVALARRIRVAAYHWQLDEEIAAGVDPRARAELALRAAQLVRPRHRRRLARCAERLVAEYDAGSGWRLTASVPFVREQVGEARGTLLELATVLRGDGPVDPRGVALFAQLLTDSSSPVYVRRANGALQLKVQAALYNLGEGWNGGY
jgi:hypothetical protein